MGSDEAKTLLEAGMIQSGGLVTAVMIQLGGLVTASDETQGFVRKETSFNVEHKFCGSWTKEDNCHISEVQRFPHRWQKKKLVVFTCLESVPCGLSAK